MSDTIRPQDQGTHLPIPATPAADPAELAREVERLRRYVSLLEARLVKANAERDEVARKLAEEHRLSEGYRLAVQELMREDWTFTEEELGQLQREGIPFARAIEEVERMVKEATNG